MSTVFKKGEISEDVSELTDPVALNVVIVREDVGIEQGGAVGSCVCVCVRPKVMMKLISVCERMFNIN